MHYQDGNYNGAYEGISNGREENPQRPENYGHFEPSHGMLVRSHSMGDTSFPRFNDIPGVFDGRGRTTFYRANGPWEEHHTTTFAMMWRLPQHRNLLQLVTHGTRCNFGERDVETILVMESYAFNLQQFIEQSPASFLRLPVLREIAIQVMSGLRQLHRAGFAHGDITTRDIVIVGTPDDWRACLTPLQGGFVLPEEDRNFITDYDHAVEADLIAVVNCFFLAARAASPVLLTGTERTILRLNRENFWNLVNLCTSFQTQFPGSLTHDDVINHPAFLSPGDSLQLVCFIREFSLQEERAENFREHTARLFNARNPYLIWTWSLPQILVTVIATAEGDGVGGIIRNSIYQLNRSVRNLERHHFQLSLEARATLGVTFNERALYWFHTFPCLALHLFFAAATFPGIRNDPYFARIFNSQQPFYNIGCQFAIQQPRQV